MSLKFSPLFFLIPWYIFQICGVFINKVSQGWLLFSTPPTRVSFLGQMFPLGDKKNSDVNPTKDFFIRTIYKVTIFLGEKELNSPCLDNT